MILQKLLQKLKSEDRLAGKDEEESRTAYKVLTPTGKINRHRRRETQKDARGVDRGTQKRLQKNGAAKRRKRRKMAKESRKRNRKC